MARVTIEDCVEQVPNRFLLVQAAIKRMRQLIKGSKPLIFHKNQEAVMALREIAARKVRPVLDASGTAISMFPHHEIEGEEALVGVAIEEVSADQMMPIAPGEASEADKGDSEGGEPAEPPTEEA